MTGPGTAPVEQAVRALRVERLACRGFRNLVPLDLAPGGRFNVVHGDNGAGKSSLLEAIHYVGALRSFRGARTDDLIQIGAQQAELHVRLSGESASRVLRVQLGRTSPRRLTMDGKRPRSIAAWDASVQVVLFHPGHLSLASGPRDERRAFLDRCLGQMDPTYGTALASYQKALRSRNRLLKQDRPDRRAIQAYDELLATSGAAIGQARARLVDDLRPRTLTAFAEVIGDDLPLSIAYQPRVEPEADALRKALRRSLEKDLARGFTAEGPHADELALSVREVVARHHASQGQHRAIVLALKVAELNVLTDRVGRVPILLLDDVSSELDRARNRRFFQVLARLGGQVFLTTTHPEFILLDENRCDFRVRDGAVEPA